MSADSKKVVLITGASSGFGKVTSALLAKKGEYRVFGTSRNPSAQTVGNASENYAMLPLDVDSDESAEACANTLLERTGGRLDVLVNNAGFVLFGSLEETSLEEAKQQIETNLFGAVRMTKAVLPTMRKQRSGKIINIGSIAGHIAVPFQGYYSVSKFALEGFTEALRLETRGFGIDVSIVEPGFFKTNLAASAKQATARIDDYAKTRTRVLEEIRRSDGMGEDPVKVGETIVRIIESKKPKAHYAVGRNSYGILLKRIIPQSIFEGQIRRMFRLDE